MIVLVLVIIWVAALAPFVLRKLSEYQLTSSVARFGHLSGMFRSRSSALSDEYLEVRRQPLSPEVERRLLGKRARVRRQRRRRTLTGLGGVGAFALVFGAIPALRPLWDLAIADVVLSVLYVSSLAYLTRLETFERERRELRNVYPIGQAPAEARETRVYAAVGARAQMPTPIPLRPAFRIVEAPN